MLFIGPISMPKRSGLTLLRPSFWRWMAWMSRKRNRGERVPKRGMYCGHNFLGSIETHNLIQEFFFDTDLHLRRHDYSVNIAGGFPAAQLTSDYLVADGIHFPSKRRAYTRGPDRRPNLEMRMISIDISEVRFEHTQVPSREETVTLSSH